MKRSSSCAAVAFAVLVVPLATACSTPSSAQTTSVDAGIAARVDTVAVTSRAVPRYLPLTGQLKSGHETDLAANALGRVIATYVERGSKVKAGDLIAKLDIRAAALSAAEASANVETASAAADSAKTECDRARSLVKSGAIAQAELDRMDAQCRTSTSAVSAAQARSRLAAQAVGDGAIRAPFDGVITERFVDVGEYVHADSRVATLVDLDTLRLELTIPEINIAAARAGAKVKFTVSGYPDRVFSATLKFVGASVRSATRDVVAEAVVDDADVGLRPGMFAAVRMAVGEDKAAVVPRRAVVTRDGHTVAFVVADGRVEQRVVQVGDTMGEELAVTRGIADGEKLVTAPDDNLRNGLRASAN